MVVKITAVALGERKVECIRQKELKGMVHQEAEFASSSTGGIIPPFIYIAGVTNAMSKSYTYKDERNARWNACSMW